MNTASKYDNIELDVESPLEAAAGIKHESDNTAGRGWCVGVETSQARYPTPLTSRMSRAAALA